MNGAHTSAEDWKAAADFVGEAALLGSFAELDAFFPSALRKLFRADLAVWERFGNDLRHLAYRVEPAPAVADASLHPAFERHFPEHPGFERFQREFGSGMLFLLSDFSSTRRFVQTGLWREVYVHLRAKHQLGFSGRIDEDTIYSCGLNRVSRDYGPRDRELARFIQPRLTRIARATKRREAAERAASMLGNLLQKDTAFACVTPDGRIIEISPAARALLHHAIPGDQAAPAHLPGAWSDLRDALRENSPRQAAPRCFRLVPVSTNLEALVVHFAAAENLSLVLFGRNDTEKPPRTARLTPREAEIFTWLGEGKSNGEIAVLLGISPRTVGKHCETLFAKLGVESRLAAALLAKQSR